MIMRLSALITFLLVQPATSVCVRAFACASAVNRDLGVTFVCVRHRIGTFAGWPKRQQMAQMRNCLRLINCDRPKIDREVRVCGRMLPIGRNACSMDAGPRLCLHVLISVPPVGHHSMAHNVWLENDQGRNRSHSADRQSYVDQMMPCDRILLLPPYDDHRFDRLDEDQFNIFSIYAIYNDIHTTALSTYHISS